MKIWKASVALQGLKKGDIVVFDFVPMGWENRGNTDLL
jgi:hypothetical protein